MKRPIPLLSGLLIALSLYSFPVLADDSIRCRIRGHIEGYPKNALSHLIIVQSGADIRIKGGRIVPVQNGKFDYTLTVPHEDGFMLSTDDDNWNPAYFFAENTELYFIYAPDGKSRITYAQAPLTHEWQNYLEAENKWYAPLDSIEQEKDNLYEQNREYAPLGQRLAAEADSVRSMDKAGKLSYDEVMEWQVNYYKRRDQLIKEKNFYSADYMRLQEKEKEIARQADILRREWLKNHPSLTALYLIGENYNRNKPLYNELFKKHFATRYKDHPLTKKIEKTIADRIPKVGDTYPDYTAPDLSGKDIRIADLTKGNFALIDLWASWCGPCRTESKLLIPIYRQYKDRGFTIVGIARERGNTNAMEEAIKKDGYPWTQLVELNDRGNIWFNHGMEYVAGRRYLLDKNGKILAIDPSAEEVAQILSEHLGPDL